MHPTTVSVKGLMMIMTLAHTFVGQTAMWPGGTIRVALHNNMLLYPAACHKLCDC